MFSQILLARKIGGEQKAREVAKARRMVDAKEARRVRLVFDENDQMIVKDLHDEEGFGKGHSQIVINLGDRKYDTGKSLVT